MAKKVTTKVKAKRSRRKFTLPLAVVAGFAPVVSNTFRHGRAYGITAPEGAVSEFSRTMIGVDPNDMAKGFQGYRLKYGLWPALIGLGIHKAAGLFGVNRAIAQAGIPIVRI